MVVYSNLCGITLKSSFAVVFHQRILISHTIIKCRAWAKFALLSIFVFVYIVHGVFKSHSMILLHPIPAILSHYYKSTSIPKTRKKKVSANYWYARNIRDPESFSKSFRNTELLLYYWLFFHKNDRPFVHTYM